MKSTPPATAQTPAAPQQATSPKAITAAKKLAHESTRESSNLLIIADAAKAKQIQQALSNSVDVTEDVSLAEAAAQCPAPVLTFANSLDGARFCLEDRGNLPAFDAALWFLPSDEEFPRDTASELLHFAGPVEVIAVVEDRSTLAKMSANAIDAGLRSTIALADLNAEDLDLLLQGGQIFSDGDSDQTLPALRRMARGIVHEIRNPLSCIQMSIDLMRIRLAASQPIETSALDRITKAVEGAETFLADLADMSQSAVERRHTDLRGVARRALAACRAQADSTEVRLSLNCGGEELPARIHPLHMRQVFAELINNAIDASPAGSEVRVRLRRQGEDIRIDISDSGPGLPADPQKRRACFQPFFTAPIGDADSENTGDHLGLGLARVASMLSLHDARASLDNRPEGGAIASFHLPLDTAGAVSK